MTLTRQSAAAYLGLSLRTIDAHIAARTIPHIKHGGRIGRDGSRGKGARVVFRSEDLERWQIERTI